MSAQETLHALAHGLQPEVGRADVFEGHPEAVGHVVLGMDVRGVGHCAAEKHVEGVDHEAGVFIEVGEGKEVVGADDRESCLLAHFAGHAFFARLLHVDESSRQVECSLGRAFATSAHEQFTSFVEDESHGGRAGIEVVGESAVGAMLGLGIVHLEACRAAHGAMLEFV